jgi:hypothetical protein
MIKKMLGFSPCVYLFSHVCIFAAAKAGKLNGPFAARLKSCPDAYLQSECNFASSLYELEEWLARFPAPEIDGFRGAGL